MASSHLSRRSFVALSAMLPWAFRAHASSSLPVGLELYSVRNELKKDPEATVRAVAQMGYRCVEFYSPYFDWTETQNKQMRKLMDDLGIRCYSTHNNETYLSAENIHRTEDMNLVLGCKYVVVANAQPKPGPNGWMLVADMLNSAADRLEPVGLMVGYHNHQPEFTPVERVRPMEVLAKNTKSNPGRIHSIHCKDWSRDPAKGYQVLFGEGSADWKSIFAAAESVGGVEYYLVEQEGSRFPELETAQKCLQAFRTRHPA
jgi:sugar phosphate isomerase/epimerase